MDSTVPSPPPSPRQPRDFADLARRISSRTTDLFAIALIVVVALTIGLQVTRWWRAEPPTAVGGPADAAPLALWDPAPSLTVDLQAGDWILKRSTANGTAEAITADAVEQARQIVASTQPAKLPPPTAAEEQWLAQLREWAPVSTTDNGGRVFALGGPWPWIVATIDSGANDSARVVCWMFALPQAEQSWTMYTARHTAAGLAAADGFDVPLPMHVQRLLHARSEDGNGVTTFMSDGSLSKLKTDWDQQLTAAGWTRAGAWSETDQRSRGTFERSGKSHTVTLDATLARDADNVTRGLAEWRMATSESK